MRFLLIFSAFLLVSAGSMAQEKLPPQPGLRSGDLDESLVSAVPEGWQVYEGVTRFTPDNLYEQINGRAIYYLSYDCSSMTFMGMENAADPNEYVDVSVYEMPSPTTAFGVFSAQRPEVVKPLSIGRDAYEDGGHTYLWIGPYYVQVIVSDTTRSVQHVAKNVVNMLTDVLPDDGSPVWGLEALPDADLTPGSIKYYFRAAMGLDFLTDTYFGTYTFEDTLVTAYLSERESSGTAEQLLSDFQNYAISYGEGADLPKDAGYPLVVANMGDTFDVLLARDNLVMGVFGASSADFAVRAALWFAGKIGE